MGIFGKFMESLVANRVRANARGITQVMMVAAVAFREKFKDRNPSSIFCGRWALSTRPYWRKISETSFQYEKSGEVLDFPDTMSLTTLIEEVVEVEISFILLQANHAPFEVAELVLLARQEVRENVSG